MNKLEFKPCPFCGSKNIGVKDSIIKYHSNGKDTPCSALTKVWAYCRYCGAEGKKHTGDFVYDDEEMAAAMDAWNDRPEDGFLKKLEYEGIGVEDFTGHLGALFDENADKEESDAAFKFLERLYQIATDYV